MSDAKIQRLTIIGFGEVGGIFSTDLTAAGMNVTVFDILLNKEQSREAMLAKAKAAGVRAVDSMKEATLGAELVIAAVTAGSALDVAKEAAGVLKPGQFYMDLNSVSPATKMKVGEAIAKSGADFVEAAVVAPVAPQRLKVPMLLGGARAGELAIRLKAFGMDMTAVSERIGVASAIKMCRSVVMKGMAALAIESLFAARRYGAEEAVLASFEASYPSIGWAKSLPDNLAKRSVEHSRRRAAEMREVAETLKEVGINPVMAMATAEMQDWLTAEMEAGKIVFNPKDFSWRGLADAIDARTNADRKRA